MSVGITPKYSVPTFLSQENLNFAFAACTVLRTRSLFTLSVQYICAIIKSEKHRRKQCSRTSFSNLLASSSKLACYANDKNFILLPLLTDGSSYPLKKIVLD